MTTLAFPTTLARALKGADLVLVLVPEGAWKDGWAAKALEVPWLPILEKAGEVAEAAGPTGKVVASVNPGEGPSKIVLGLLPESVSRHNAPSRAEFVATAAAAAGLNGKNACVLAALDDDRHALPVARAVARTLPLFSQKSKNPGGKKSQAPPGRVVPRPGSPGAPQAARRRHRRAWWSSRAGRRRSSTHRPTR